MLACLAAAPRPALAGCPAYPPELAGIKVEACRFYDPAKDAAFAEKVRAYFKANFKGAEIEKRIAATMAQNTGLLISGVQNGDAADGKAREYFYRTKDEAGCAQFETGQSYIVNLHRTCVMVFFEAPADIVVTLASEDGKLQGGLFGNKSVIDRAAPVAPQPALHVDDNVVLDWAEGAVASAFAKGIAAGDENQLPEYFTAEGWSSFRRAAGGGMKPVAGLLKLADPIIVQKLTNVIGPDNAWAIDWDCDFEVLLQDGEARRATHISAFVRRLPAGEGEEDGEDKWAITGLDVSWKEAPPPAEEGAR